MTVAGWIFMSCSLALVWLVAGWCCYKVLTAPSPRADSQPGPPAECPPAE